MASAADIIVNLVAKTARFERSLDKANRSLTKMAKVARTAQRAMKLLGGAIIAFGAGRLAGAVRQQLQFAANLERVAETVGFTTEEIQGLRFAADQLNLTQQSLDVGLQRFSRRAAEAAIGTGELLKVAQEYNIVLRGSDGSIRNNIDLLGDLAEVVAKTTDEQEQLRIAFKAFDTEGASLVRLLRGGRDAVQDFLQGARELGLVIDESMIRKAAEGERQIRQLSSVLQAKLLAAVVDNIEQIQTLVEVIGSISIKAIEASSALSTLATNFKTTIVGLAERTSELINGVTEETVAGAREQQKQLAAILEFSAVGPEQRRKIEAEYAQLQITIDQFFRENNQRSAEANARALESIRNTAAANAAAITGPSVTAGNVSEIDITDTLLRANVVLAERKRLRALVNQTTLEEVRILDDIRFINRLIAEGDHDQNELLRVRKSLFVDLQSALDKGLNSTEQLNELGVQAARNLQSAFADTTLAAIQGNEDILASFRNMIQRMLAELIANRILLSFFGALSGGTGQLGGLARGIVGGLQKRHDGGAVNAGQPYLVGKPGAEELFVPNQAGNVKSSGFGGNTIQIFQNNEFNGSNVTPEQMIPILESNNLKLKSELLEEIDRGEYA